MKKIIAVAGVIILILGGVLVALPVKVWDFPKEVNDLLTRDRRQWAFKNVPYVQQGYKIHVVFSTKGEKEGPCREDTDCTIKIKPKEEVTASNETEKEVFAGIIDSTTFFKIFPSAVVRQLPPNFTLDGVKVVSVAWTVGHEGDLIWEAPKGGDYTVVFLPDKGELPIPVSGKVYWETDSQTYRWAGVLAIIIGAAVTIRGVRGRLLPSVR